MSVYESSPNDADKPSCTLCGASMTRMGSCAPAGQEVHPHPFKQGVCNMGEAGTVDWKPLFYRCLSCGSETRCT
jgi:hypothetical protein